MGQVVSLNNSTPLASLPEQGQAAVIDPNKIIIARQRVRLVAAVNEAINGMGWSLSRAAEHIAVLVGSPSNQLHDTAIRLGKSGKTVGKAQIARWFKVYEKQGLKGLIDQRSGRKRKIEDWELRAKSLYSKPQKPSFQIVTDQLEDEGFEKVTSGKVRRYLKSLPTDQTSHSNGRRGAHFNQLNHRKYVHRDTESLPVGFIYQGDGHTCDVYVAHPNTGDIFRPELTVWIDVRSRYITGWWLGEVENSTDTLFSLSHAMTLHNHVPAMLHVDHGAGYRSHLMNDESVGFYHRFDMETIFAIPGNAKGKGQVERWFGTMERSYGKRWDSYCGADMAGDALRKITKGVKRGTYTLPSLDEYREGLRTWIERYHNTKHRGLKGQTPAAVWAQLEPVVLDMSMDAVVLPVAERKVRRLEVHLHNRVYRHDELLHHEGQTVHVQYSVHTDQAVRVLSTDGYWICNANIVVKKAYLPDSRLQEAKLKRLKGQQKRLQIKADENVRRALIQGDVNSTEQLIESDLVVLDTPTLSETLLEDLSDDDSVISESPMIDVCDTAWAITDNEEDANEFDFV